jgi:hypothetical protein
VAGRCWLPQNVPAMNRAAIALLVHRPDRRIVAFHEQVAAHGYDLHVVVDDNDCSLPAHPATRYVRPDERQVIAAGFIALNHVITNAKKDVVSAWEKALYHFSCVDRSYSHVWFIEDDVFIPSPGVLPSIDASHPAADLLCSQNKLNLTGEVQSWSWWRSVPDRILPLPWASSMVCVTRLSRALLDEVGTFVIRTRQPMREARQQARLAGKPRPYLFIEYLFNTLALHRDMKVECPDPLATVVWRSQWAPGDFEDGRIYHPVKDAALHDLWRASLRHGGGPGVSPPLA